MQLAKGLGFALEPPMGQEHRNGRCLYLAGQPDSVNGKYSEENSKENLLEIDSRRNCCRTNPATFDTDSPNNPLIYLRATKEGFSAEQKNPSKERPKPSWIRFKPCMKKESIQANRWSSETLQGFRCPTAGIRSLRNLESHSVWIVAKTNLITLNIPTKWAL